MKPEELMIKDWVLHDREPYQIRQLGIYGVNRDGEDYPAVCVGKPKGIGLIIERNEIEPIPLTPEILEKNGFIGDKNVCKTKVRDDSKDELWQCEYAWYLKNLRIKNRTNGSVARLYNIMFVHELQHAMRLCGINKEIEI